MQLVWIQSFPSPRQVTLQNLNRPYVITGYRNIYWYQKNWLVFKNQYTKYNNTRKMQVHWFYGMSAYAGLRVMVSHYLYGYQL